MSFLNRQYRKAWAGRPLVWLLPFFLAGLELGWRSVEGPTVGFLAAAAGLAGIFWLAAGKFRLPAVLLLPPAALFLGLGLMLQALTPPDDPAHVLAWTAPDGRRGETVILGGVARDGAEAAGENYRFVLEAREIVQPGKTEAESVRRGAWGRVRVTVGGPLAINPGDYLRFPVRLSRPYTLHNPRGAEWDKIQQAEGLWAAGFVKSARLITSWPAADGPGLIYRARRAASQFIRDHCEPPAAGLLAAQLLGERGAVDLRSEETYRALGLSHVLAVSGLHLGIWYGLCCWAAGFLLRWSPLAFRPRIPRPWATAALALIPTLFYAALVGSASSVLRAALMIGLVTTGFLLLRRTDPWNILAAAAWIILLVEPHRLQTISFQLSFTATAAMVAAFKGRAGEAAREKEGPAVFQTMVRVALYGSLSTGPLVLWHFGYFPAAGFLGNLAVTPIMSLLVIPAGLLAVALLPLSPALAGLVIAGPERLLQFLMPHLDRLADLAGPGLLWPPPGPFLFAAFYLSLAVWLRSGRSRRHRLAVILAALALGWAGDQSVRHLTRPDRDVLRLTVLDVGQGFAAHLTLPDGAQMLVDGGGTYFTDPGERVIRPYLLRHGLDRLDVAVSTHPDLDHLKGLATVARDFSVGEIWSGDWPADWSPLYAEFLNRAAGAARPGLAELRRGRSFGPARVDFFWPPPGQEWPQPPDGLREANSLSLVFKISWGGQAVLVTGDIEAEAEKELALQYGSELRASILLAPHHGGRAALVPEFLAAVQPDWVVFSAGRNNSFGLPHPETVQRARDAGARVHRTDLMGAAVFEMRERDGRVALEYIDWR